MAAELRIVVYICKYYIDNPRFGGPGRKKQCCVVAARVHWATEGHNTALLLSTRTSKSTTQHCHNTALLLSAAWCALGGSCEQVYTNQALEMHQWNVQLREHLAHLPPGTNCSFLSVGITPPPTTKQFLPTWNNRIAPLLTYMVTEIEC